MSLVLGSCGYQLRGQSLSLKTTETLWVQASGSSQQLAEKLQQRLKENKVALVTQLEEKGQATVIVDLNNSNFSQSPSAFDNQGDIIEYDLRYQLWFEVNEKPYRFSASESYDYSQSQLLSSERNRKDAEEALVEQALNFILRQL